MKIEPCNEKVRKLAVRLLAKSRENGECLEWTGGVSASGYGIISVNNMSKSVHRVSYIAFKGPIPDGKCVLHKCDNRICILPDHLFIGTLGENNTDRELKGRSADRRGEKGTMAKITADDVRKIRTLAKTMSQRKVGDMFGLCQQTVWAIVRRKNWSHIE